MRNWNPPGELAWKPKQTSGKIKLTCRFISPVFGGGVDPKKPDEITPVRVPSIRGQLRFWWRATHADLSLGELRKKECEIFGGVHGDKPVVSALSLQVTKQPKAPQRLEVFVRGDAFKLAPRISDALAYGAFPLRGTDAAKTHDLLSVYADHFDLELSFPAEHRKEIERALWAWLHFGGLGGRTRRGFGAIEQVEQDKGTGWKLPSIQEGWPTGNRRNDIGWAVLGARQDSVIRARNSYNNGRDAQEALLGLLRRMRQGDQGRKPNKPRPGRSYWPEPDAIRAIFTMIGGRHGTPIHDPRLDKFPRAMFGAPIIFHFKTEPGEREPPDSTLVPVLNDRPLRERALNRLSSSLILRPHAGQGGRYEALALRLDHPRPDGWALLVRDRIERENLSVSLSDNEAARITPLHGPSGPQTDAISAYLDRLAALLPKGSHPCRPIL